MTRRYTLSVPDKDDTTQAWMDAQENVSFSIRCLIRDQIGKTGIKDYFQQMPKVQQTRKRRVTTDATVMAEPKKTVSEPVQQPKKPVNATVAPKQAPVFKQKETGVSKLAKLTKTFDAETEETAIETVAKTVEVLEATPVETASKITVEPVVETEEATEKKPTLKDTKETKSLNSDIAAMLDL